MMLFLMQGIFEPVASESRWKSLGRMKRIDARRKQVIVPLFAKEPDPEPAQDGETLEEKRERVSRLIGFTVVKGVLGLSDTEGPELAPREIPGWRAAPMLVKLA